MKAFYETNFEEILEIFCLAAKGSAFSVRMDDDFTLLYGNESYYQIHEYTKESMFSRIENKCVRYVHPDDLERVRAYCAASVKAQAKRIEWEMRIITGRGNVKYVKCAGATALLEGQPVMHGFVLDITENRKLKEENVVSESAIRVAMQQTGISFWSYDLTSHCITQDRNSQKVFGFGTMVENVPECFWGTGVIHPGDEDIVKEMYEKLFSGAKTARSVARWRNLDNGKYWWAEIVYTIVPDIEGNTWRAIGSAVDVSERIELEKKYDSALSYKGILDENVMGSFHLNLSLNLCGEGQCLYPEALKMQEDGTADGFYQKFLENIPDNAQKRQFEERFSREALMECFTQGTSHVSMEHRFRLEGDYYRWVVTHANVVKNPVTSEIEAFFYAFDIDRTKMLQLLMEHTMDSDYDYVALVGASDEEHRDVVKGTSDAIGSLITSKKHSEIVEAYAECLVLPDDRDRFVRENTLPHVLASLKKVNSYAVAYRIRCEDGGIAYKRARYSYLSNDKDQIAFSVADITQEMEAEQKRNDLLGSALTAARQANSAKTDFLSRMSHEIRTPMNAIIGMTAVMAQSVGDDVQIENCISKIGMSSRFLLSLINDILDMSRIESGKVLLKNERIPFAEFVGSINSICYAQANARDIDYECIVGSSVEDAYMGDAMKLQQVLINILSNAIKFTSAGGRVSIDIQQIKKTEHNATLRFSINDTGCGIEDEYIPHLFEPFSQGHSGGTAMYSGTGLGLAICKNLVELMDGKIDVRSIVGVGSEFSVTIKLGVTEETKASLAKKIAYSFDELVALVVDDDVTVCQYTVGTLSEIGLKADWVDSGRKAVDQVKGKWEAGHHYDLILLDWKMPDMDGIETARAIREVVGPEVTIIIMTAYDWAAIEHEARMAGVNMLISKPLFKSSLVSAFCKAFNEKNDEVVNAEPPQFDFRGKRVLLVEDHPLNVEVARKLLEVKGFQVEHAENGLRAIEMVTLAQDGFYDAILMDIRMPVMDGLQACRGIRNLTKDSTKTVPIIAMTANAFDDDVDRSKKVGMNAHLAKPIEPDQLYRTLYHYIFNQDEEAE